MSRPPTQPQRRIAPTIHATSAWDKPFLRIGHGGAAGHARANSIRSLSLALEMGVDMVEFDVRPCLDELVLLHDDSLAAFNRERGLVSACTLAELQGLINSAEDRIPTLAEALELLKGRVLVNVDVKAGGCEEAVVETVRRKGMQADVLYSSLDAVSLRRFRQLEPGAMTGFSYPEDRTNASGKPYLKPVVDLVLYAMRLALPYRILAMMVEAQANAVMLHHKVISGQAVLRVHGAGGKTFAWTVDDAARVRKIRALGVDGITTNYPEVLAGDA